MKVVVDTKVFVSGLLWGGPPNRILRWAREGILEIVACEETTAELRRVTQYKRFSKRLSDLSTSSNEVFSYFMNLIKFVPTPETIPQVIKKDPFDNIFLALASENKTHLIISGDGHLLDFREYKTIQIVMPSEASRVIETLLTG
jgi:putative PIN family toxin of toxin-antitoxin system